MKTIAIIPARMNSGRFPGKPLKDICGLSMIAHCYLRTRLCKDINRVVVATPNEEIEKNIKLFGGDCILTPEFDMCNDRIAWAYEKISKEEGEYNLVFNVQGDQPLIYPEMISDIIEARKKSPHFPSYTLVEPCSSLKDFYDLNRVKVVFRESDGGLIYMSRAPIPSPKKRDVLPAKCYKHVAVIAFEPQLLRKFVLFGMTYNEEIEGIDFNRVVEMGAEMQVIVTNILSDTVDNQDDLDRVKIAMSKDNLWLSGLYK